MSAFSAIAPSSNRRRILSVWLPRLSTDRLRRIIVRDARPDEAALLRLPILQVPWVVVAKEKSAVVIVAVDDAAAQIGLEPGTPLANARAMCPDLHVIDEDRPADAAALNAIADWCDRFTPLVALDTPHGLFLDITGCAHLFGGERAMLTSLCDALKQQGFVANAAIAGTAVCARALTRVKRGAIVPIGGEAEAVSALPLFALGADDAAIRGLRRAGLKTIGDVAARGAHEITARFGDAFSILLRQALGQIDAPISPRKPLPDYLVEKRFAEPIATEPVILGTLDKLACLLIAAMERDGKGARKLETSFFRTDGLVVSLCVETSRPVTQMRTIERLFREKLDALADPLDPGFGFDLIRLSATHAEIVTQEQRDLDAHSHDEDELVHLIDRIAARIGPRRVIAYLPADTHVPERAMIAASAQHRLGQAAVAQWVTRIEGEPPLRPLRLLAVPEEIDVGLTIVPDGAPKRFVWRRALHQVVRSEGPERISMEWWRHQEKTLTRDYFRIENEAGQRFWLYRDGLYGVELITDRGEHIPPKWFMHGVFA